MEAADSAAKHPPPFKAPERPARLSAARRFWHGPSAGARPISRAVFQPAAPQAGRRTQHLHGHGKQGKHHDLRLSVGLCCALPSQAPPLLPSPPHSGGPRNMQPLTYQAQPKLRFSAHPFLSQKWESRFRLLQPCSRARSLRPECECCCVSGSHP